MPGYALMPAPGGAGAGAGLLIIKKGARARGAPAERYVALATGLPRPPAAGLPAGLPGGYRKRRGIGAGYRDVKRMRPMAAGRSLPARLARFFFSLAVYNAWMMPGCRARPGGLACVALFTLISHMIYGIPPAVPHGRGRPS